MPGYFRCRNGGTGTVWLFVSTVVSARINNISPPRTKPVDLSPLSRTITGLRRTNEYAQCERYQRAIEDGSKPARGRLLGPAPIAAPLNVPDKVLKGFPRQAGASLDCSAIYYLLEAPGCSVLHRVTGDMSLTTFTQADPVQMLLLIRTGKAKSVSLE